MDQKANQNIDLIDKKQGKEENLVKRSVYKRKVFKVLVRKIPYFMTE